MKHVIWVLWPAFIAAGIAEVIFFTMIDPEQLYLFGELVQWSAIATYSTGFLLFWLVCIGSSLSVLVGFFSSFYSVPANSVDIVQRFGAYLKTAEPGLHFKLPWGIDMITPVEVARQQKLEFGFATQGATNSYQYAETYEEMEQEKTMVTGDLNTALVEWVVQYTIEEPEKYLFTFRDPLQTLRDLSEASRREVVGDRSVDEVLTVGRQEMEIKAAERLRQLVKTLNIGIRIDQIQLGNVNPPRMVETLGKHLVLRQGAFFIHQCGFYSSSGAKKNYFSSFWG